MEVILNADPNVDSDEWDPNEGEIFQIRVLGTNTGARLKIFHTNRGDLTMAEMKGIRGAILKLVGCHVAAQHCVPGS